MTVRFKVERLGSGGDGVADDQGQPVYIPFTLPGEEVTASRVRDRAALIAVLQPSALRVQPPCRHFGDCGGCALQHLEHAAYLDWKRSLVVSALRSRGIEADVLPTVPCAPQSRRRARFSLRRTEAGMLFGYHRALSATIVDIDECPILRPTIVAWKESLRALGAILCATSEPFRMAVTETLTGLDVSVDDAGKPAAAQLRSAGDHAIRTGLARLLVDGQIVVEPHKPIVRFGAAEVTPPPGGFLQAVESAEDSMADLVQAHLEGARKIVDLFSGSGAFALRLAAKAEVRAVESDALALAALDRGFRSKEGLRRVTVERRDLERRPLTAKELNAFSGLVFDPPRGGAEAQAGQIARSDVPLVAAVSCNPATLARDLRILIDGGYRLKSVTPVDQFLWSAHVEAVALLDKPRPAARRKGW